MKPPVHLICACNSDYIMPLSVMLSSVVDHFDPNRKLVVHVISNDATATDRENVGASIRATRPDTKRIDVHWYAVDPKLLVNLPVGTDGHFTRDAYARLFAPYILPEDCERAVYLDCDLVVLTDISRLYDSTADNPALLQAAHDLACPLVSSEGGVFDYAERGIPADTRYFNSGVMVIDLKRWRERDLTPPMLDYLTRNGDRIAYVDQGAMNAFLYNEWTPLDARWNQTTEILKQELWLAAGYTRQDWQRAKNEPYVVHFTGRKPWKPGRRHSPRRIFFFRYLQRTVYRNTVPRYPYLETILGVRAYYELWRMLTTLLPHGYRRNAE